MSMNLKNLTGINSIFSSTSPVSKTNSPIKSESSNSDRDANGQQQFQKQSKKEKMTEEQFQKAISLLKEKKFISDMNWHVIGVYENDVKYAWVKDSEDNSIRKIIEFDLWEVLENQQNQSTKGQLLSKTG